MNSVRKLLLVWCLPDDGYRMLPPWQQQRQQQVLQEVHTLDVVDVALNMLQFLRLSSARFHNYLHQDVVPMVGSTSGSLPQCDSNGMEILVRVVVLVTDMVDVMLLLFKYKTLLMFLFLISLKKIEQFVIKDGSSQEFIGSEF